MKPTAILVGLDRQEEINMDDQKNITINIEVQVAANGVGEATVSIPPEIRLTERLVNFLNEALKARDLQLKHWAITTPEHEQELENLPNVTVGQTKE